ncbi:MAG: hypothetical protein J0L94_08855 [Rhodothermia bacterium]|nr:hypothetical protein [Rhodothermia bacterium]
MSTQDYSKPLVSPFDQPPYTEDLFFQGKMFVSMMQDAKSFLQGPLNERHLELYFRYPRIELAPEPLRPLLKELEEKVATEEYWQQQSTLASNQLRKLTPIQDKTYFYRLSNHKAQDIALASAAYRSALNPVVSSGTNKPKALENKKMFRFNVAVLKSPQFYRYALAACFVFVASTFSLRYYNTLNEPLVSRLASVEALEKEMQPLHTRSNEQVFQNNATYQAGLELLQDARYHKWGIFIAYDAANLNEALHKFKTVVQNEKATFPQGEPTALALDAQFFMAKAYLGLENVQAAREALQQVINHGGMWVDEAQVILAEMDQVK